MALPLVLTRAADDAAPLAAALRARGWEVVLAPCLVYREEPPDPGLLDPWRGAPATLGLTSPRAVPALARLPLDPAWTVRALAPRTADAARAAGIRVDQAVPGGAADLARGTAGTPFILLGSDLAGAEAGAVNPATLLRVVYRTLAPPALPPLPPRFDVFFASPSAVANFDTLAPGALLRADRVFCHGATTAAAVRARGLPPVPCTVEDLLHATPPSSPSY